MLVSRTDGSSETCIQTAGVSASTVFYRDTIVSPTREGHGPIRSVLGSHRHHTVLEGTLFMIVTVVNRGRVLVVLSTPAL